LSLLPAAQFRVTERLTLIVNLKTVGLTFLTFLTSDTLEAIFPRKFSELQACRFGLDLA
jgi:hypothetical protein